MQFKAQDVRSQECIKERGPPRPPKLWSSRTMARGVPVKAAAVLIPQPGRVLV